ncbi:di-trans,poly-cis-decaprenylcistransferase [bacterium]|nr:di-trans,poly-cis-decaprenylcistransferase [bacterium]
MHELRHLVVIPDGDRRWAKEHNLPPWEGHRRGAENIRTLIEVCKEKKIHYLTMWGFSTENWSRSVEEVEQLMNLFRNQIKTQQGEFIKNEVRFRHLGRKDRLAPDLLEMLTKFEEDTAHFTEWNYQAALDYGGQDEIIRAVKKLSEDVKAGKVMSEQIDVSLFESYLDTKGIPNPDLIIRTSGERRISGLLPFQSTYAELEFIHGNFPDLTKEKILEIIDGYYERHRTFGK